MSEEYDLRLVHIKGGISLWLPDKWSDLATYVFLEQENWFEPEVNFVHRYLQPGMRVIDVGAAFGAYSLPMAAAVGPQGRVWSYEPTHRTANILKKSAEHNEFGWQEIVKAAVSDTDGETTLSLYNQAEFNRLSIHESHIEKYYQPLHPTLQNWHHE